MSLWNEQEDIYWRDAYNARPYYSANLSYPIYQPAYRYGYDLYDKYKGKQYNALDELELRNDWERVQGAGKLAWEQAKFAVKDAYDHLSSHKKK